MTSTSHSGHAVRQRASRKRIPCETVSTPAGPADPRLMCFARPGIECIWSYSELRGREMPFEEIAPIIGRSTGAARQLASRARRRVQGQGAGHDADRIRQSRLVEAFLTASRRGESNALLALLDPEVVLRADMTAVKLGAMQIRGAAGVASEFLGRSRGARPALVNVTAGAVWLPGGRPRIVFAFTVTDGKITGSDLIAGPDQLRQIEPVIPGE